MTDPPEETVPAHVALLRAFANTLDVDDGSDALPEPGALAAWLREHSLVGPGAEAGPEDLQVALALRDGVRAAMAAHHDREPDTGSAELEAAAAAAPLRVSFAGGEPHLAPLDEGVRGGLARLLVAVAESRADGTWRRLKVCPADDCQWAFYDTSKNRTRVWCAMGVCGNRTKTRAYRARKRHGSDQHTEH